jgi:hypothetical protein
MGDVTNSSKVAHAHNKANAFLKLLETTDIVRLIQEYVPLKGLFATTKMLAQARRLCLYWNLNGKKSLEYCRDQAFRDLCTELMSDTRKQLSLVINREIADVSMLGNVHKLYLINCSGIVNVSMLGNVNTLNLSGCTGISDVSMLGNVRKLVR